MLIQGKEQYAIDDKFDFGPAFGGGHDIFLADKCNQNNESYTFFPTSYNCGSKYQRNQQTYTLFSGAKNGNCFRVIDYEVFELVK